MPQPPEFALQPARKQPSAPSQGAAQMPLQGCKCRHRGAVQMPLQGGGRHQVALAHPLGRRSLALGDRRKREGGMMPRGQQIDRPACQLDVPDAKLIF